MASPAARRLPIREYWSLAMASVRAWNDDYAPSMGAALAYYTAFSLAPLLIIVIAIAGLAFGQAAARGEIVGELTSLVGPDSAKAVEAMLAGSSESGRGLMASIVGFVTLLIGATSVFGELQSSLDRIWKAPAMPQTAGLLTTLRERLFSFGMVLAIGFLLLVSLVIGAALTALGKWSGAMVPGALVALQVINLAVGFGITTALFAMTYRLLPRVSIEWSDVWMGAVVTAGLFTVGKYLVGLYIGHAGTSSAFGAAGSLIVVLVWVYYSAQIFLLGAEFTWLYAHRHGSRQKKAPAA